MNTQYWPYVSKYLVIIFYFIIDGLELLVRTFPAQKSNSGKTAVSIPHSSAKGLFEKFEQFAKPSPVSDLNEMSFLDKIFNF